MTNARCLTEGVDVPTLNGVAFIDPRRSQIDIVQAVGRAIRKSEDKTVGTIVIPVFVDEEADAEQALGSGEFNRVWEVVKALRAHDDLLADELDELRRELGRRNTSVGRPAKIHFDLPVGIGDAFIRAFDTKLVETATSTWEFWFGLLQCFVERNGHALVPHRRLEQGYRLGAWVANQRTAFREHRMANDRTARLQALPGWVWNTVDAAWEEGFSCLERRAAREGHARAPQGHVEDDYRLGSWVSDQCEAYHAGPLPEERIARLEALPGWAWNRIDAAWEEAYAILDRFAAREGHARVPRDHVEDGCKLGAWVGTQRVRFRAGLLANERAVRLQALPGWLWDTRDVLWEKGYSALKRFAEREGHPNVQQKHSERDFPLGKWVNYQRRVYRAGRLANGKIASLEALPGWTWSSSDAAWEEGLSHLHASPPAKATRAFLSNTSRMATASGYGSATNAALIARADFRMSELRSFSAREPN